VHNGPGRPLLAKEGDGLPVLFRRLTHQQTKHRRSVEARSTGDHDRRIVRLVGDFTAISLAQLEAIAFRIASESWFNLGRSARGVMASHGVFGGSAAAFFFGAGAAGVVSHAWNSSNANARTGRPAMAPRAFTRRTGASGEALDPRRSARSKVSVPKAVAPRCRAPPLAARTVPTNSCKCGCG